VLVGDVNANLRNFVVSLLEPEFDVVAAVADGREFVDAESKLNPNIGIIDISMPIMNGIEAAKEIKKSGSLMDIIFLTVNEDSDFVRAAFEAGAIGYVAKRFMASDLPDAIRAAKEGRAFISSSCSIDK
jgi:DNA-binding NarL/FixJ family response regulator